MTINSAVAGTNAWSTAGAWSLGHVPLDSEDVIIPDTAYITTAGTPTSKSITIDSGGALFLAPNVTLKTNSWIRCSGSLISQGSATYPAIIDAVTPTTQWYLLFDPVLSYNNVLDYLWLKNNKMYLGNETVGIQFNDRSNATGSWINNITPLTRAPIIINHSIDGRAYGRTYRRGSQAGVVTVSGHFYHSSFEFENILNLQALNTAVCLTTERVHLSRASIDGEPRYQPKAGALWCPFSITLIEDG